MHSNFSNVRRFFGNSKIIIPRLNSPLRLRLRQPNLSNRIDAILAPEKIKNQDLDLLITERAIEYPFVFRKISSNTDLKVFEFGCANSILSLELVSTGYNVTGIDLRNHQFPVKNFNFIKGNLFDVQLPQNEYDTVIAVSALEHIGLAAYGEEADPDQNDRRAAEIFSRILVPGGQLILTVPAGKRDIHPFFRIYDDEMIEDLLDDFEITDKEYYVKYNNYEWEPVSAREIGNYSWKDKYDGNGAFGLACVSARLKK